ncbi:DCP1 decapping enzyme homolog b (Saccharomyces cerevisiae) [Seminavis robusta]|uniref:DCP1 decapping enzyme homolog b (Saccharomyces cerevisiae) n=1 Tax=Seminavis robusta TaxID=568900 RepID=A0A9N8EPW0_9STRA|nr:DCP1 decapping enzyme homolog b (Saccharomyces cerevisiae) [Seminavis robusta]|eukprot:Sro1516_g279110.1 DCP1 decapping enzyme homolog b (Saccharomyces cerevisiae) (294) ;mRNA; r:16171-17052
MAAALTEDARKKANLRLLQRSIDANIQDIVGSATHVVLYEYIAPQGWEKSQVEGSLFLVASQQQQQQQPSYSLAILNRHSTENFKVAITERFQLQHKEPYLIFKQSPKVLGIWFHNGNERVVMASLLNQVIQNLQQRAMAAPPMTPPRPPPPQQQPPPPQQQQQPAAAPPGMAVTAGRPAAVSPMATTTTAPRSHASVDSPSQLIEPLMNSLFVAPPAPANSDSAAAGSDTSGSTTPTRSIPGVALDKKSLQLALLSLIQDERFIDLLHAQYLKVAHARASRNNNNNNNNNKK